MGDHPDAQGATSEPRLSKVYHIEISSDMDRWVPDGSAQHGHDYMRMQTPAHDDINAYQVLSFI